MNKVASPPTQIQRTVVDGFDRDFAHLHAQSCRIIETTPPDLLYAISPPTKSNRAVHSIGEYVLRSAGAVEQTCGGITANLWDDPFEWTLPEVLSSSALVREYLNEVEETRKHAFACFAGDQDLLKDIVAPAGGMRPLADLLKDTLERALAFQGRAAALLAALSNS